jgi:surface polysaccharide O-acyltransferase-like enzyme
MTDLKKYQELQSKTINWLRFPLIIGVLFIHNGSSNFTLEGKTIGTENHLPIFYYCSTLILQFFGHFRVPFFFFVSGFLFFLNLHEFDRHSYVNKLKGRAKTLLVPYLFWNLLTITIVIILSAIPQLSNLVNREFDFRQFLNYFWNHNGLKIGDSPFSYQFWFIRDLMVAVVFTPIIYFLLQYTKFLGLIAIGVLWFFGFWFKVVGFSSVCIFFFSAGAYFGINKRNLLEDFGKIKNISFVLYPLITFVDLLTKGYAFNGYIQKAGVIIGIIFSFNLVAFLFEKKKIKPIPFLSASSFFVFAIHEPFLLTVFRRITFLAIKPESDFAFTSLYFVNPILVALVALGLYYILNRFLPKFTSIITGGR